jgi:chaperonin cofactor prefoldin
MSKLISLSLNNQFGVLKAQEVEFVETENLIEVKAAVGKGKTTLKNAAETAISAGNQQLLPFDGSKFKDVDLEVQVTYGNTPVFLRTYSDKKGNLTSVAYIKDVDGKMCKDPVIGGKKLTAAALRDALRTDLTFGIDDFLSENPRTHLDFMMKIYSHKLKEMGVVFDTKSPDYKDSILWRLEQAKMDRQNKHIIRRGLNAFKEAFDAEGLKEENVPALIPVADLEAKKTAQLAAIQTRKDEWQKTWYAGQSKKKDELQKEIDEMTAKASQYSSKIAAYNVTCETQKETYSTKIKELMDTVAVLQKYEYPNWADVSGWVGNLEEPNFEPVPLTTDGKIDPKAFEMKFQSAEIAGIIAEIKSLREKLAPIWAQKEALSKAELPEYVDTEPFVNYDEQIARAAESNKIANRWAAFYDWQDADETVKSIWREYCEMYSKIDLGVPGLSIQIVGDEEKSEIRTMYNGVHNPEFFGNIASENRLLTQYSQTQRPVIAILMQIYLLEEKLKKNEDGLRLMWIECPIDKKTRDLLIDIQTKYNINIIVGVTGDFTVEGLNPGEFLIEGGELISLK